jgi:hypothetical protein
MPILVNSLPCVIPPLYHTPLRYCQKNVRKISPSKRHGSHLAEKEKLSCGCAHAGGRSTIERAPQGNKKDGSEPPKPSFKPSRLEGHLDGLQSSAKMLQNDGRTVNI